MAYIVSKKDDRQIKTHMWPVENAKADVQILHGICEHAGRYSHVADSLNQAGYQVFSHDHRGFGGSLQSDGDATGAFAVDGHFADQDGWSKALLDIEQVRAAFSEPSRPCFLLAHSMGSFMAQAMLQSYEIAYAGVALSGTKGPLTVKDRIANPLSAFELWRCGARNPSPLADALMEREFNAAFKPTRTAFDWICSDESVVRAYVEDPLSGGTFTTRLARDLVLGYRAIFNKKAGGAYQKTPKGMPLYLFSGDQDPVSEMVKGVKDLYSFLTKAGFQNLQVKVYEGMRHETLNELGKEQVISDLIEWFDRQSKRYSATGSLAASKTF